MLMKSLFCRGSDVFETLGVCELVTIVLSLLVTSSCDRLLFFENELVVTLDLCFIREGFWDRQRANIASRYRNIYRGNLFRRPNSDF